MRECLAGMEWAARGRAHDNFERAAPWQRHSREVLAKASSLLTSVGDLEWPPSGEVGLGFRQLVPRMGQARVFGDQAEV